MSKLNSVIIVGLTILLFQACNGNTKNNSIANADSTAAVKGAPAKLPVAAEKEDVLFAAEAAGGGITEIELGKLAIKKGGDIKIKNFGAMMVKDHRKANSKLMALAKTKNINLPTAPGGDDQKTIDKLSEKSGRDFDKAYVTDMIADHKKDIIVFENASKHCFDPDIKAFAAKTLPVLQNHLDAITAVYDTMK